ncbi:hypothetical protein CBL_03503 [Carabus blaptoides fortunei]
MRLIMKNKKCSVTTFYVLQCNNCKLPGSYRQRGVRTKPTLALSVASPTPIDINNEQDKDIGIYSNGAGHSSTNFMYLSFTWKWRPAVWESSSEDNRFGTNRAEQQRIYKNRSNLFALQYFYLGQLRKWKRKFVRNFWDQLLWYLYVTEGSSSPVVATPIFNGVPFTDAAEWSGDSVNPGQIESLWFMIKTKDSHRGVVDEGGVKGTNQASSTTQQIAIAANEVLPLGEEKSVRHGGNQQQENDKHDICITEPRRSRILNYPGNQLALLALMYLKKEHSFPNTLFASRLLAIPGLTKDHLGAGTRSNEAQPVEPTICPPCVSQHRHQQPPVSCSNQNRKRATRRQHLGPKNTLPPYLPTTYFKPKCNEETQFLQCMKLVQQTCSLVRGAECPRHPDAFAINYTAKGSVIRGASE